MQRKGFWGATATLAVAGAAGGFWWLAMPHATEAEAAQLRDRFAQALGAAADAVTITPAGDHYNLTIRPETFLAPRLKNMPGAFALSPYRLHLTSEGKGMWRFDSEPQALAIHAAFEQTARKMTSDYRIEGLRISGHFSEALQFCTELTTDFAAVEMDQTEPDVAGGVTHTTARQGPSRAQYTARAGATGIDISERFQNGSLVETIVMPAPPAAQSDGSPALRPADVRVGVRIEAITSEGAITGLRWPEILTLLGRVTALHPEAGPVPDAAKPELAQLFTAALPLFDTAGGRAELHALTIDVQGQTVTLARAAIEADLSGLSHKGSLREAIDLEGLGLPASMRPDWAEPLIPGKLRLDASLSDFDLQAPLQILAEELSKGGTAAGPEFESRIISALLPTQGLTVRILPSQLVGPGYRVDMAATAGLASTPVWPKTVSATLRLAGLDTILTALQKAPEDVRQAGMALMMARGFAKLEPDGALSWALSTTPDGVYVVNGTKLGRLNWTEE